MIRTQQELGLLFDEVVAFYFRLRAAASAVHGLGELSGARRTVLTSLARLGPQSMAQMARARSESRQRFQPLVKSLLAEGLIRAIRNPAHKRSHLLALTARGRAAVRAITRKEIDMRTRLPVDVSRRELLIAINALRQVSLALEAFSSARPIDRTGRRRTPRTKKR